MATIRVSGTTAPEESVTVPLRLARFIWAEATEVRLNTIAANEARKRSWLDMAPLINYLRWAFFDQRWDDDTICPEPSSRGFKGSYFTGIELFLAKYREIAVWYSSIQRKMS